MPTKSKTTRTTAKKTGSKVKKTNKGRSSPKTTTYREENNRGFGGLWR